MSLARARATRGRSASFPAPTAGWVTRKNIADMKPDEALELINYIPQPDRVVLRGGQSTFATMAATQSTLFSYQSGTTSRLLSAGDGKVFNITAGGNLTGAVALGSGYTSNIWQWVNFGTVGGQFVIAVNGSDTGWAYNGSTLSSLSITGGSTVSNYINVTAHARRLFFIVKNSLTYDYLSVETIGGTASTVDLTAYCKRGGYLVAAASWTVDSGDGVNDVLAFITSQGEVLAFQGTNPGDANAWSLIGVFSTSAPIGYKCFANEGSELYVLTTEGPRALSAILRGQEGSQTLRNIEPTFKAAASSFSATAGWQVINVLGNKLMLFNVPATSNGTYHQYVWSLETEGWCKFTNWNATNFVSHNGALYCCGADAKVYQCLTGTTDGGGVINGDIKIAFNYLGGRNSEKQVVMVRPVWEATADLTYGINVNMDFANEAPIYSVSSASSGTPWGSLTWASWTWGNQSSNIYQSWEKAGGLGRCASLWLRTQTTGLSPALLACDWVWEQGGLI